MLGSRRAMRDGSETSSLGNSCRFVKGSKETYHLLIVEKFQRGQFGFCSWLHLVMTTASHSTAHFKTKTVGNGGRKRPKKNQSSDLTERGKTHTIVPYTEAPRVTDREAFESGPTTYLEQ
jgi:hypothetical protein